MFHRNFLPPTLKMEATRFSTCHYPEANESSPCPVTLVFLKSYFNINSSKIILYNVGGSEANIKVADEEFPQEGATRMPVRGLRKRCRDRHLAAVSRQKKEKRILDAKHREKHREET
jgi:hypothetical protein